MGVPERRRDVKKSVSVSGGQWKKMRSNDHLIFLFSAAKIATSLAYSTSERLMPFFRTSNVVSWMDLFGMFFIAFGMKPRKRPPTPLAATMPRPASSMFAYVLP